MKKNLQRLSLLCLLALVGMLANAETVSATWDWQNGLPSTITETNIQGTDATGTVASDVEH